MLLSEMLKSCADIALPSCHNVKGLTVGRFVTFRLRIWAKSEQVKLADERKDASEGEMGSRSMAMRLAVSKLK